MKQKITNIIILLLLIFITICLLSFPKDIMETINFSISLWVENIVPSLFPFFIISELLINYGFINIINKLTKNITYKLFHLSGNASFVFITSMLTGFPSSAKYINDLLQRKIISIDEASHLLMFTHFPNPLFVTGTIGTLLLNNNKLGYLVLISIYIGNVIIALLTRPKELIKNDNHINMTQKGFVKVLIESIFNVFKTLILLLGIITVFLIVSNIIKIIFNLDGFSYSLVGGIFEMTQGIKNISSLNILPIYKVLTITAFIAFGGFSIHMQTFSILDEAKIKYKRYFICRILHVAISCTISFILYNLFF